MKPKLTDEGRRIVDETAARHGVSSDAVMTLLDALIAGHGIQAQFSHPDLGGMGQWSQGGMTMVGDMFNNALKYRVDALCTELSGLLQNDARLMSAPSQSQIQSQSGGVHGVSLFVGGSGTPGAWWPEDLGQAGSTGAQNNLRYAVFPSKRRLAIDINGAVTVYDTGDHVITGFSQQQSGGQTLTFTSQHGLVRVTDLAVMRPDKTNERTPSGTASKFPTQPVPADEPEEFNINPDQAPLSGRSASSDEPAGPASPSASSAPPPAPPPAAADNSSAIFTNIKRLAELHEAGILTDDEFQTKKTELLSRL